MNKQPIYDFSIYADNPPYFATPREVSNFAYRLSRYICSISDDEFDSKEEGFGAIYNSFETGVSSLGCQASTEMGGVYDDYDEDADDMYRMTMGFPRTTMCILWHKMAAGRFDVKRMVKDARVNKAYELSFERRKLGHCDFLKGEINLHSKIIFAFRRKYSILSIQELEQTVATLNPSNANVLRDGLRALRKEPEWDTPLHEHKTYMVLGTDTPISTRVKEPSVQHIETPLVRYVKQTTLDAVRDLLKERQSDADHPTGIFVGEHGTDKLTS